MKRSTALFCGAVMLIDSMPAYRRLYPWVGDDGEGHIGKAEWTWMRRSFLGTEILDRMGLLFPYFDHINGRDEQ